MAKNSPSLFDQALGKRIRVLRLQRQCSQQTLANALGVSFQQVQKYEQGHNRLSTERLCQIAHLLNVSPGSLLADLHRPVNDDMAYDNALDRLRINLNELKALTAFQSIQHEKPRELMIELMQLLGSTPSKSA